MLQYDWDTEIAPYLHTITNVVGGFTLAKRGVITIADGSKVFVKIATEEQTEKWLAKEIDVYQTLNGAGFEYIPQLLAHNTKKTAMAITYLDGASFENVWDEAKLAAVITAQENLKKYKYLFLNNPVYKLNNDDLGIRWDRLLEGPNLEHLNDKLAKLNSKLQASYSQIKSYAQAQTGWSLSEDTLIHEDIRADNFGYDASTKTGKLVDWNWLAIGDESLDITGLFVSVHKSAFKPYDIYPDKYNSQTVLFLINFWLLALLDWNMESEPQQWKLRLSQAESAALCIQLYHSRV